MTAKREWVFALDWNNPVATPAFNVFQLFGATMTWDDTTWMFHLSLALIVVRIGRVDTV